MKLSILYVFLFLTSLYAYTTSIHAPAVLTNEFNGSLTLITLNLTSGNGNISIKGPYNVSLSTYESAQIAVSVATNYLNINRDMYNYTFYIHDNGANVSGPSAGLAMTLLTVAALENKQLYPYFTVTGIINPNGTVGLIGGVYDKVEAAKIGGMKYMLVPYTNDNFENLLYYLSQNTFNIPLIEVNNLTTALRYAFGNVSVKGMNYSIINESALSNNITNSIVSCTNCTNNLDNIIINVSFNLVNNVSNSISKNFSNIKSELAYQINQDKIFASHGYYYAAGDLAFLDFVDAFPFAFNNINKSITYSIFNYTNNLCNINYTIPNANNYEYVAGAELRLGWANYTITYSNLILSSAVDSDQFIEALYNLAPAIGWCSLSRALVSNASQISSKYYINESAIKRYLFNASKSIPNVKDEYTYAFNYLMEKQDYLGALYDLAYIKVFDTQSNLTNSEKYSFVIDHLNMSFNGVWPSQFASEAQFYIEQAQDTKNSSAYNAYVNNAYTTMLLAIYLNKYNNIITSNLTTQEPISNNYIYTNSYIDYIFYLLGAIIVILIVILIAIMYLVIKVSNLEGKYKKDYESKSHRRKR